MNAVVKSQEIEGDLRTLCVEYGKQFSDVKQAAERAILQIRSLYSTPLQTHEAALTVLRSDTIFRPLLLACATKLPKLVVFALASVQKLLAVDAVTPEILSSVIGTLRIQAESDDESILLKILQTLLLAISPQRALVVVEEAALSQALGLCFKLNSSANPMISNTASATLNQVVTLLFDRVPIPRENSTTPENGVFEVKIPKKAVELLVTPENLGKEAKSAYLMFQDLCILCSGDSSMYDSLWLKLNHQLPMTTGLELMESILQAHTLLFTEFEPFRDILQIQLCPLIIKLMSDKSHGTFPILVRLMRIVLVLIKEYHSILAPHCEILLSFLVRFVSHGGWLMTLSLEVIRSLATNSDLLYYLFCLFDESDLLDNESIKSVLEDLKDKGSLKDNKEIDIRTRTKIVGVMSHALSNVVLAHQNRLDDEKLDGKIQSKAMYSLLKLQHNHKSKYLDSLNDKEVQFDDLYSISLAIDSLVCIVQSLSSLINRVQIQTTSVPIVQKETEHFRIITINKGTPSTVLVSSFASVLSVPVLTTLNLLLIRSEEEGQIQHLLTTYQLFTNACGLLGLKESRDAFLSTLCNFATPSSLIKGKNIQSYKALFNICHCLGGCLDTSWAMVISALDELNKIIILHYTRSNTAPPVICSTISEDEIIILTSAMNRLFESTIYFDNSAMNQLLTALGTSSLSFLAESSTANEEELGLNRVVPPWVSTLLPTSCTNEKSIFSNKTAAILATKPCFFPLLRILHITEHNLRRLSFVWDIAIGHLTAIATHRFYILRSFAVDVLTSFIFDLLSMNDIEVEDYWGQVRRSSIIVPGSSGVTLALVGPRSFQHRILQPYSDWIVSKYEDVREVIISAISKLLHNYGPHIKDGWAVIIEVLCAKEISNSNTAYGCVQLVVTDFLLNLPVNSIPRMIECIGLFGQQRKDTNTSFSAIGLLRDLATFVSKMKQTPESGNISQLLLLVLIQLKDLSIDSRSEVRNSAIQTFFSSILTAQSPYLPQTPTSLNGKLNSILSSQLKDVLDINDDAIESLYLSQLQVWTQLWSQAILPLLSSVLNFDDLNRITTNSVKASESAADMELGKDKSTGKSVKMLSHYSRATAEKQWDESILHTILGISRLWKVAMLWIQSTEVNQNLSTSWGIVLRSLCFYITEGGKEVSAGAITALSDILLSPFSPILFDTSPSAWNDVVDIIFTLRATLNFKSNEFVQNRRLSSLSAFTELSASKEYSQASPRSLKKTFPLELFSLLITQLKAIAMKFFSRFSLETILNLVELCADISKSFLANLDINSALSGKYRISNVQQSMLQFLEELLSLEIMYVSSWDKLFNYSFTFLLDCVSVGVAPPFSEANKSLYKAFCLPKFAIRSAEITRLVFLTKIPSTIRCKIFLQVCNNFTDILTSKRFSKSSEFSKEYFATFKAIIPVGLRDCLESEHGISPYEVEALYALFTHFFDESFYLLPDSESIEDTDSNSFSSVKEKAEAELMQLSFVTFLCDDILPLLKHCDCAIQVKFINLLNISINLNSNLLEAIVSGLFNLCSLSSELSNLSFPILLQFCRSYLQKNVATNQEQSIDTIKFSILLLQKIRLFAKSSTSINVFTADAMPGLFISLFPLFCDCIQNSNSDVRLILADIFRDISSMLPINNVQS